MDDLLVDYHTIDKLGVQETLSLLLYQLNIVDICHKRISSFLNDPVNSLNRDLCKMFCCSAETLTVHSCHGHFSKSLRIFQVNSLRNLVQNLSGLFSRLLVTCVYYGWMNTLIKQQLGPFQKLTGYYY